MDEEECAGWLAGDDYRRAVEAAGVVELPEPGETESEPVGSDVDGAPLDRLLDLLDGRFEETDPPGAPR